MKTAIVYYSRHHENTLRLIKALADGRGVELIDAAQQQPLDLSGYDLIGFASGIYYSRFHKSVVQAAEGLRSGQSVFFIYTCGNRRDGYTGAMRAAATQRGAVIRGEYGCLGFNTFGPFKLIGGMAKGHPDQQDIAGALEFFDSICK
ncbi:MAG: flavodoxin family protein [Candidatus Fimadaptatus sp.]